VHTSTTIDPQQLEPANRPVTRKQRMLSSKLFRPIIVLGVLLGLVFAATLPAQALSYKLTVTTASQSAVWIEKTETGPSYGMYVQPGGSVINYYAFYTGPGWCSEYHINGGAAKYSVGPDWIVPPVGAATTVQSWKGCWG
jgi:hypothetical protein